MTSPIETERDAPTLPPHRVVPVTGKRVACNGGGGALGHPKVYYDLDANGEAHCFYCCAHFVRK